MKKIIGIALALVLVLGVAAFAEGTTDPVSATPAVTEEAATPAEETAPTEEATPATDDNAALQDALDAYRKAKQDKAVDDLETELNEYVAAGSLTQEQADLILNSVKERLAAKNGECPNCGYQFSKGGMKGQQRGGMQRDGKMGGMQRPDAQSGATPRQGGMQDGRQNGQQQVPQMNGQMNGQIHGNQMPGVVLQR